MFITIRRYRVKLGQADQALRMAEVELVPIVSAIPGFVDYQALVVGAQSIASISSYRDRAAADSANSVAADWDERRLATLVDGPAEVTVGEVRMPESAAREKMSQSVAV